MVSAILGQSPSWLSKKLKTVPGLLEAVNPAGKRIDVTHPEFKKWLKELGFELTKDNRLEIIGELNPRTNWENAKIGKSDKGSNYGGNVRAVQDPEASRGFDNGTAESISEVMATPLADIIDRFGDQPLFSAWLKDLKTAEEIREKRLRNEATEGSIVKRDAVIFGVMSLMEELSMRLLGDGARTITTRNYSSAKSGEVIESAEQATRKIIDQNLKKARDAIGKTFKRMGSEDVF